MTNNQTTPRLFNLGVAAFVGFVLLFGTEECDDDTGANPDPTPSADTTSTTATAPPTTATAAPTTATAPPTTPTAAPTTAPGPVPEQPAPSVTIAVTAPAQQTSAQQTCSSGVHCTDVNAGIEERWFDPNLVPYKASNSDDVLDTFDKLAELYPDLNFDEAKRAIPEGKKVGRGSFADAMAIVLGYDTDNTDDTIELLAADDVTVGFTGTVDDDISDFRAGDDLSNGQMASFINRLLDLNNPEVDPDPTDPVVTNSNQPTTTTLPNSNQPTTTTLPNNTPVDPPSSICEASLNDLTSRIVVVAGATGSPPSRTGQTAETSRTLTAWLYDPVTATAVQGAELPEAGCETRILWRWDFAPSSWVTPVCAGPACTYQVTSARAIDGTIYVQVQPRAAAYDEDDNIVVVTATPATVAVQVAQTQAP